MWRVPSMCPASRSCGSRTSITCRRGVLRAASAATRSGSTSIAGAVLVGAHAELASLAPRSRRIAAPDRARGRARARARRRITRISAHGGASATSTRSPRRTSTSARRSARSRASGSRRARPRSTSAPNTRGTCASCSPSRTSSALPFPIEYGGTGTGTLMLNMAVEEIAKVDAVVRADPDGAGARHAADPAVRLATS